ncbi:3(2),5-bisphosphate nucleotidase HAL2 [Clavulina sp. PMI_390]|nr:3(2),5-bisphosphate nucleotidase HAL2 [Clavulina sp. PMI_390]
MSAPFELEKRVAVSAVLRAVGLTSSVFNTLVKGEVLTKEDKSPVTIGDFSAQAAVNTILTSAFPADPIVGEEDAEELRGSEPDAAAQLMRDRITQLANEALAKPALPWEKSEWGVGATRSIDQLLDAIDKGNHTGGCSGRMWVLDPIDGTKGFLRGEQYAVCLGLVVDGVPQLGVLGCPNLPVSPTDSSKGTGALVLAVRGQGAFQASIPALLSSSSSTDLDSFFERIEIPAAAPPANEIRTLESVEAAHSAQGFTAAIARALGLSAPANRMDSQAKYAALARGWNEGHLYLRMPVPGKNYIEKIWDHAAGNVIVTEAGGIVTDSYGAPLDFGLGRTLGENKGIIACAPGIHAQVVEAIKVAREEEKGAGKL